MRRSAPQHDYGATVEAIRAIVAEIEASAGATGSLGIGTPGAISPASGLLKNANSTWLNRRPLGRDLESALGRPIRMANDADCFALSEAIDGAAEGARSVFGVIVGTGTGGGVVIDGRPLAGPNAIAGEWGHNPLPWPNDDERPGPGCYCGKHGCIETWLSGPGLARDHRARGGEEIAAPEVSARARAGDPRARATLDAYVDRMARALASVINLIDPEVIVLGGGMSNVAELYDAVPERWSDWVFTDAVATRLVPPRHGDASGVRGAALLW